MSGKPHVVATCKRCEGVMRAHPNIYDVCVSPRGVEHFGFRYAFTRSGSTVCGIAAWSSGWWWPEWSQENG